MSWSLSAAGHAAEELEHELVEKLHEVLTDPRFGSAAVRFVGDFVSRDVLHTAPLEQAPAVPDVPQEQPSAQAPPAAEPEPSVPAEPASASDAVTAAPEADAKPAATEGGS